MKFSSDMKWKHQVLTCVSRANTILGRVKRAFSEIQPKPFKQLYTALVRPHLEFAVPVWSPYLKSDIEMLEKVQRRAVKWIKFDKGKTYKSKLRVIGIQSLTDRRMRGDLIQTFKWSNDIDKIQSVNKPEFNCDTRTRGHSRRYKRELIKNCNARYYYLTNRIGKQWNKLPEGVALSPSMNSFKSRLGNHFKWP